MKPAKKIARWIGLFLLFFVASIFPLIFLSSHSDMNLQGFGPNITTTTIITTILKWTLIIAVISSLIFFIFQKLSSIKFFNFGVFNFLLAFLLGSILFAIFGWFYFPHYNNKGFVACKSLAEAKGEMLTPYRFGGEDYYDLTQAGEKIDAFIEQNGKPTSIESQISGKDYNYENHGMGAKCILQVNQSGIIETIDLIPQRGSF